MISISSHCRSNVLLIMVPAEFQPSYRRTSECEFITGWETSECHSKISYGMTAVNESLMFLLNLSGRGKKMAGFLLIKQEYQVLCSKKQPNGHRILIVLAALFPSPWRGLFKTFLQDNVSAPAAGFLARLLLKSRVCLKMNIHWIRFQFKYNQVT